MPRNDEGEFELVLGNRQLLSGFFIVVILFGIFFTMGYIVGRHSSPAPLIAAAASSQDAIPARAPSTAGRSEEHTSELQSRRDLVCRLLLEKKKKELKSSI